MATPARFYSSIALQTSLTAGITAIDTTIMVASTTGFPGSTPYTLALDYGGANEELVDVTAQAGLSLTVTRAVDGTSASTHNAGAVVRHVSSARDFTESRAHEAATQNVHGVTGVGNDVVGTTSTQTLSNKTLNRATGTLQNVDLFNVGAWVTSVIGDSTQASLSKFAILNNEVGLQEMAVFTGNGALYSYKQAGDVDGSYRIRVTDTDTTTDRFFVLAGGATKVVPTAASTFVAQDIAAPDTSTSKRAIRVSANGGGTERFTVWNSGQMDVTPTSAATSGLNVRVTSGSTPVTRFFAANPGPQTADLTQWVNSSNTIVGRVDKDGNATFNNIAASGVGQLQVALKTADTSRANTATVSNDPHLFLPVVANGTYILDGWLKYFADPAPDFKMTFATPGGTLGEWHALGRGQNDNSDGPTVNGYKVRTESNDVNQERNYYGTTDSSNPVGLQLKGTFRVAGTGGNVTLQWSQGTSDATATIVYTDSWIRLHRIA